MGVERLSPLDASFLEIEEADESSHMHVGWAMIFDPLPGGAAPDAMAIRRTIGARLGAVPRFAYRLSSPRTGGLSWPTWEDDPLFDLGAHVRHVALPPPGGEEELLDWLADFYSHRLDRARPLWEITLLTGLEGGSWALAVKVHHCLVDGASANEIVALLLDSSPDGTPAIEMPPAGEHDAGAGGTAGTLLRGARAGVGLMLKPRQLFERSRAIAELVGHEIVSAPDTSVNVPIGATRRLAAIDTTLAEVKAIKRALGGTVNDVALAVAAGGLRELLLGRGEPVPDHGLRVMVPVSVRSSSERLALGNRVSSLFVDLPVSEPDALTRYRKTVAAAEMLKWSRQGAGAEALVELAGLAPPALHALVARLMFTPRLFNVTITNVRGAPVTLFALGAPMRRIVPLVPIFANHAVGIAIVSYDGTLTFGLNADRASVPDLDALAAGMESSLSELRTLARRAARSKRRGKGAAAGPAAVPAS